MAWDTPKGPITKFSAYSPHLGRISVDVDDGGADHFGQVRRVVSGPAAVLGRRETHLRLDLLLVLKTVGDHRLCMYVLFTVNKVLFRFMNTPDCL